MLFARISPSPMSFWTKFGTRADLIPVKFQLVVVVEMEKRAESTSCRYVWYEAYDWGVVAGCSNSSASHEGLAAWEKLRLAPAFRLTRRWQWRRIYQSLKCAGSSGEAELGEKINSNITKCLWFWIDSQRWLVP